MANIPLIDMNATGDRINALRKRQGMTVKDLQTALGFNTPQAIYKWIHGTPLPPLDNLVILAAVLDVGLDDIIVCRHLRKEVA